MSTTPSPEPASAAAATPAAATEEATGEATTAAENLTDAMSSQNETVADVVGTLDSLALSLGEFRVSLWDMLIFAVTLAAVLAFAWFAARIGRRLVRRVARLDRGQKLLAEKIVTIVVWTGAFFIGVDLLGIDLTALAVFGGALGLAVGFGLQKTLGNLIAGLILLMDKSIKPGDVIAVSDMAGNESFGEIRKIGIRAISIVTRDRKEYLIPNENLMINQVENWSYSSREVRVKAPVGVAYGSDLDLVERLLHEATVGAPRVLENPKPAVRLMAFGDNAVNFEIRFWIEDPEDGVNGVRSEVYKRVWRLFKEHEIEMPFPQRDINFGNTEQFEQLIAAISQRLEDREARES